MSLKKLNKYIFITIINKFPYDKHPLQSRKIKLYTTFIFIYFFVFIYIYLLCERTATAFDRNC